MRSILSIAIASVFAASATAQWTVTILHPAAEGSSSVTCGEPGLQGGNVFGSGYTRGGLWRGSAASWINLTPDANEAYVAAVANGRMGGSTRISGRTEASLWNAATRVRTILNPPGVTYARVYGMSHDQQAGTAQLDPNRTTYSAVVWNGSASSFVNLAPAEASNSYAYDVDDGRQVGYVILSGRTHRASLWSGSAASRVDLDPPGFSNSEALAIHGDQQVGWAGGGGLASLWRGTAASWVNLNPPAASGAALAVHNGVQVGYVEYRIARSAALWRGSAATFEDLSLALPPTYSESEATSVWADASTLYVGGYARDGSTGRSRAIIWSRPLTSGCTADFNADGFIDFFDYADFVACFEGSPCAPDRSADINRDGFVDFFDYDAFVAAFEGGC